MKTKTQQTKTANEPPASDATSTTPGVKLTGATAKADVPKSLRRLKWNELVHRGDFVADAQQGFEPWEGPSGFRADAFVKPIYRRERGPSTTTEGIP
jgi:hypothetical protein